MALMALAACSYVPDAVNPATWFESEPAPGTASAQETAATAAEEPFPRLGTVPEAPSEAPEAAEFDQIAQGLAADAANAQYTDATLRRSSDEVGAVPAESLQAPQPAATAATVPEPEPATTESVVIAGESPPPAQPLSSGELPGTSGAAVPAQPLDGATVPAEVAYAPAVASIPASSANTGSVQDMFSSAFRASGATTLADAGVSSPMQAMAQPAEPLESASMNAALATRQVATVYFGDGSAALSRDAQDTLLQVAYDYGATGGPIRIVGHASAGSGSTGSKLANLDVSMNRAVAVADALAKLGVPTAAMTLEAASDNQPATADDARNRRVEIFLGG